MKVVVCPNYIMLCKSDMHQESELFDQKENPNGLALGGIYEVLREEDDCYILKPEEDSSYEFFKTPKYYLREIDNKEYSYKVGDEVYFAPICTEPEKKLMFSLNRFKEGEKYKIYRIINFYYLELINNKGEISNPIRFCDVTPVT